MENPFPAESQTTAPNQTHHGAQSELPQAAEAGLQKEEAASYQAPLPEQASEHGNAENPEAENTSHSEELPAGGAETEGQPDSRSDEPQEPFQEGQATEVELIPLEEGSLEDFAARAAARAAARRRAARSVRRCIH
jgi:hypothetical protein